MRVIVALCLLLLLVTGCASVVTGTAQRDGTPIPAVVTEDGSGIRIGSVDAPVQLEIYTEPQCRHCADLQADFGDELAYYVAIGRLALTYRPMALLDKANGRHSARVANAMFAAVSPAVPGTTVTTTGPAFQRFVTQLWTLSDGGPNRPTVQEMAGLARATGIPDDQVARIEAVQPAIDTTDTTDANFGYLYLLDPVDTALPYVYDLKKDRRLDVYDDGWLAKAMES